MSSRTPHFKVGEHVRVKFRTIGKKAEKGVVTDSYEFIGQHRYISDVFPIRLINDERRKGAL